MNELSSSNTSVFLKKPLSSHLTLLIAPKIDQEKKKKRSSDFPYSLEFESLFESENLTPHGLTPWGLTVFTYKCRLLRLPSKAVVKMK